MVKKITLLSAMALFTLHAHAQILIMGDSLSAAYGIDPQKSWVRMLEVTVAKCNPPRQVINASISGETTEGALPRLPELLKYHEPRWVLIELGGNDALQGKNTEDIEKNLRRMVELSEDHDADVLLMEIMVSPNYGPYYVKNFNKIYHRIAESDDVVLMPFFLKDVATNPDNMQPDLVHPNEKAQFEMFRIVWPYIKKEIDC